MREASGGVGFGALRTDEAPKGSSWARGLTVSCGNRVSGLFRNRAGEPALSRNLETTRGGYRQEAFYAPEGSPAPFEKRAACRTAEAVPGHTDVASLQTEPRLEPLRAASDGSEVEVRAMSPGGDIGTRLSALRRFATQAWT